MCLFSQTIEVWDDSLLVGDGYIEALEVVLLDEAIYRCDILNFEELIICLNLLGLELAVEEFRRE